MMPIDNLLKTWYLLGYNNTPMSNKERETYFLLSDDEQELLNYSYDVGVQDRKDKVQSKYESR